MTMKVSNKEFKTVIGTPDEEAFLIEVYVPKHLPIKDAITLSHQIASLSLLAEHRADKDE